MANAAAKNLSYVMSECSVASFTLMNGKTGKWWEVPASTHSGLKQSNSQP